MTSADLPGSINNMNCGYSVSLLTYLYMCTQVYMYYKVRITYNATQFIPGHFASLLANDDCSHNTLNKPPL